MRRQEIALHHSVVYTLIKNPGSMDRRIYTLYVLESGKAPAPLIPLVEYIIEQGRSNAPSWQRDICRAVGLFIDFLAVKSSEFQSKQSPKVLAAFAESLVYGTIGSDGMDHSGLYWQPRDVSASSTILRTMTIFFDWLENRYGTQKINPWRDSTSAEKIAYWRRLDKRGPNQLLGYTTSRSDHIANASISRTVSIPKKRATAIGRKIKVFPRDRIW